MILLPLLPPHPTTISPPHIDSLFQKAPIIFPDSSSPSPFSAGINSINHGLLRKEDDSITFPEVKSVEVGDEGPIEEERVEEPEDRSLNHRGGREGGFGRGGHARNSALGQLERQDSRLESQQLQQLLRQDNMLEQQELREAAMLQPNLALGSNLNQGLMREEGLQQANIARQRPQHAAAAAAGGGIRGAHGQQQHAAGGHGGGSRGGHHHRQLEEEEIQADAYGNYQNQGNMNEKQYRAEERQQGYGQEGHNNQQQPMGGGHGNYQGQGGGDFYDNKYQQQGRDGYYGNGQNQGRMREESLGDYDMGRQGRQGYSNGQASAARGGYQQGREGGEHDGGGHRQLQTGGLLQGNGEVAQLVKQEIKQEIKQGLLNEVQQVRLQQQQQQQGGQGLERFGNDALYGNYQNSGNYQNRGNYQNQGMELENGNYGGGGYERDGYYQERNGGYNDGYQEQGQMRENGWQDRGDMNRQRPQQGYGREGGSDHEDHGSYSEGEGEYHHHHEHSNDY